MSHTIAERQISLEDLLREARTVLATLPATDRRASLLGLALQRRDGVLIDGVLSEIRNRSR